MLKRFTRQNNLQIIQSLGSRFHVTGKKITRDFLPCLRHVLLIQQCADK